MAQSDKSKLDKPVGLGEMLRRAAAGDVLYLTVKDSAISAYAAGAGVKVKTERLLAIHPGTKEVTDITRVTVESRRDAGGAPDGATAPARQPARAQAPTAAPAAPQRRVRAAPQTEDVVDAPARRRPLTNLRTRR